MTVIPALQGYPVKKMHNDNNKSLKRRDKKANTQKHLIEKLTTLTSIARY